MAKKLYVGISSIIFLCLIGCVTTPGKSFYDSKITQIEVNTINYSKIKNKDEMDKFEQAVIKKLEGKGYQAFLGPRIIDDQSMAGSAVKKLIPGSTADAFMIINAIGIHKTKSYDRATDSISGETLWQLNVMYWLFNRSGDKILNAVNKFVFSQSDPIKRNGVLVKGEYDKYLNPIWELYQFSETEDEFRSRVAAEFVGNIPDRQ